VPETSLAALGWQVQSKFRAGQKAAAALRHPLTRQALRDGVAPAQEHHAVLKRVAPGFVVDVGAHKGQFALAVRAAGLTCPILAFEPLPEVFAQTTERFRSDPAYEVRNLALSDSAGTQTMQISGHDDSSSLLEIGERQSAFFPGREAVASVDVTVSTLSDELRGVDMAAPALLKIDVQGSELDVLRGAGDTLARFTHLYVECSTTEMYVGQPLASEIVTFLFERDFHLTDIGSLTRIAGHGVVQADLLFSRPQQDRNTSP